MRRAFRDMFINGQRKGIRILLIILVLLYIPIAVNMFTVYTKTIEVVKQEKINDFKNVITRTLSPVDIELFEIKDSINDLAMNLGLRKTIQEYEALNSLQRPKIDTYYQNMFNDISDRKNIKLISCISEDGKPYLGIYGSYLKTLLDSRELKEFASSDENLMWFYKKNIDGKSKNIFLAVQKLEGLELDRLNLKELDSRKHIGYVIMELDNRMLDFAEANSTFGVRGEVSLYTEKMVPIYNDVRSNISKPEIKDIQVGCSEEYKIDGESVIFCTHRFFSNGWYITSKLYLDDMIGPIRNVLRNSIWLVLLIGFIILFWILAEVFIISGIVLDKQKMHYRLSFIEELNERFKLFKHDMLNHMQIIQGLIQLEQYEKAIDYTKQLTQEGTDLKDNYDIGIPELESAILTSVTTARNKGIDVKIDCIRLPNDINVKPYNLSRIMFNLMKNAIFALDKCTNKEKLLTIKIYEEIGEYVFEVINNLPLIPKDIRCNIFEKGYTTKGEDGNGLGLYIVKKLVEKHMGEINLKVNEEGNHFIVRFPN